MSLRSRFAGRTAPSTATSPALAPAVLTPTKRVCLRLSPRATPTPNGAEECGGARAGTPNRDRRKGGRAHAGTSPPASAAREASPAVTAPTSAARLPSPAASRPDLGRERASRRSSATVSGSGPRPPLPSGVMWGRFLFAFLSSDLPGGLPVRPVWVAPSYSPEGVGWRSHLVSRRASRTAVGRSVWSRLVAANSSVRGRDGPVRAFPLLTSLFVSGRLPRKKAAVRVARFRALGSPGRVLLGREEAGLPLPAARRPRVRLLISTRSSLSLMPSPRWGDVPPRDAA
jgi:hypothetical protein